MMKVRLKKSVDDRFWGGMDHDTLEMNPISKALTTLYLPKFGTSDLKSLLMERLGTSKVMYLYLSVAQTDGVISRITLTTGLTDDVERLYGKPVDWEPIDKCLEDYFRSVGYDKIECSSDEDIVSFVQRLEQDIPLAKEYFEIINKHDENIARIGFMGDDNEYEVFVQTDDEVAEPHFHIRDAATKGEKFETCVRIGANSYCPHGDCKAELPENAKERLMDFMKGSAQSSKRSPVFSCNYEMVVHMWNLNNESVHAVPEHNDGNQIIIPRYDCMD